MIQLPYQDISRIFVTIYLVQYFFLGELRRLLTGLRTLRSPVLESAFRINFKVGFLTFHKKKLNKVSPCICNYKMLIVTMIRNRKVQILENDGTMVYATTSLLLKRSLIAVFNTCLVDSVRIITVCRTRSKFQWQFFVENIDCKTIVKITVLDLSFVLLCIFVSAQIMVRGRPYYGVTDRVEFKSHEMRAQGRKKSWPDGTRTQGSSLIVRTLCQLSYRAIWAALRKFPPLEKIRTQQRRYQRDMPFDARALNR